MTEDRGVPGADALRALLGLQDQLDAVTDKEWAAAAGMIVKKLLLSAGQTPESLAVIKASVGEEIFTAQLKSLTHHQARQLARRLDKRVPDFEVSTASAAVAHVRSLLAAARLPEPVAAPEPEPEPVVETLEVDTAEPAPAAEAQPEDTPEDQPEVKPEAAPEEKKDPWGAPAVSLSDEPAAPETATEERADGDSTSPPPPPPPAGSSYFGRRSFRT